MLYVIDGTGHESDDIYKKDMNGGFMKRMELEYNGHYYRGPTTLDWTISTASIVDRVLNDLREELKKRKERALPEENLFLAGHSRGGYAALCVAQKLTMEKRVKAVFLFDAVDRTDGDAVSHLPENIDMAYHARRDPILSGYVDKSAVNRAVASFLRAFGRDGLPYIDSMIAPPSGKGAAEWKEMRRMQEEYLKYKWAMRSEFVLFPTWFKRKYLEEDGKTSRAGIGSINFSNCLEHERANPKRYEVETFLGSHGAIGGAPIKDQRADAWLVSGDAAAMASVWDWMEPKFKKEGLTKSAGSRAV